ncbi:MAG: PKD domain-containing protein, partial [Candidatus Pacebacteria bacterium]|nr:PKD domain-containing protein [Candidatus Paceibacterota bacterium]
MNKINFNDRNLKVLTFISIALFGLFFCATFQNLGVAQAADTCVFVMGAQQIDLGSTKYTGDCSGDKSDPFHLGHFNYNYSGTGEVFLSYNGSANEIHVDDCLQVRNNTTGQVKTFGPSSHEVYRGPASITDILVPGANDLVFTAYDEWGTYIGVRPIYACTPAVVNPVNGACGSSNGQTLSSKPTANLCNMGTASAVIGTGPWNWTCAGSNGGTTASCSANKTSPVCQKPVVNAGTNKEVQEGQSVLMNATASDPIGLPLTYHWTCTNGNLSNANVLNPLFYAPNVSSDTTVTCTLVATDSQGCSATSSVSILVKKTATPVNGACGSSNGQTLSSKPTANLCNMGTASAVTGTGPWNWTCSGSNGGSNAYCSANKTINYQNPTVNAGTNKDVQAGQSILMNATASDPNGLPLTYHWTCTGGNMSNFNVLNPLFYAPSASSDTNYTCTLTATNSQGLYASDSVNILVRSQQQNNFPPTVNAGGSKQVQSGQNINMTAAASDPQGSALTYQWTCTGGSMSNYNVLNPVYTAPYITSNTNYTCTLTVTNSLGLSASDYVNILVIGQQNNNNPPNVFAGSSKQVQSGQSVYMDATASDPQGLPLTYHWTCTGGNMSNFNVLNPTYYAPYVTNSTSYSCTLTATNSNGMSASSSVSIWVIGSGGSSNGIPVVNAGSYQTLQSGQSARLNATAYDPDGDPITYSWTCSGGSLSSYNVLNPTFYAPFVSYDTTYTCTLTASDNRGGMASNSVNILVRPSNNNNFNLNVFAGSSKQVQSGQSVYMDATASDPNGYYPLSYYWTCTGGTLSSYGVLNLTYYAPTVSVNTNYSCTLTVTNNRNSTASSSVNILVIGSGGQ